MSEELKKASKIVEAFNPTKVEIQDALSLVCNEYVAAHAIYKAAEKRFDAAKSELVRFPEVEALYEATKEAASSTMLTSSDTLTCPGYTITVRSNAPAQRLDEKKFVTELIKAGVDVEIVNKIKSMSYKYNSPATSVIVTTSWDDV